MTSYQITYTDGRTDTVDVCALDRIRCERDGVGIQRQLESVHRWAYYASKRGGADVGSFDRWAGTVANLVELPGAVDPIQQAAGPD